MMIDFHGMHLQILSPRVYNPQSILGTAMGMYVVGCQQ